MKSKFTVVKIRKLTTDIRWPDGVVVTYRWPRGKALALAKGDWDRHLAQEEMKTLRLCRRHKNLGVGNHCSKGFEGCQILRRRELAARALHGIWAGLTKKQMRILETEKA